MPVPTGVFVSVGGDVPGAPFDPRFSSGEFSRTCPQGTQHLPQANITAAPSSGVFYFVRIIPCIPRRVAV